MDPKSTSTGTKLGLARVTSSGPWHLVRQLPSGEWVLACRSTRSVPAKLVIPVDNVDKLQMCRPCQKLLQVEG
jgi:hypothetical protein